MSNLPECRCPKCNRLLFLGFVKEIAIKCPKCGQIHKIAGAGNSNQLIKE